MSITRLAARLVLFALPATLCGCGGPELYPVSGKVTYTDGTPVPGGGVLKFLSKGAESPAVEGEIQSDGTFSMATMDDVGNWSPGAPPGDYLVYVNAVADPETNDDEYDPPEITALKYTDPLRSNITVTVEAKENVGIKFEVERPIPGELEDESE